MDLLLPKHLVVLLLRRPVYLQILHGQIFQHIELLPDLLGLDLIDLPLFQPQRPLLLSQGQCLVSNLLGVLDLALSTGNFFGFLNFEVVFGDRKLVCVNFGPVVGENAEAVEDGLVEDI